MKINFLIPLLITATLILIAAKHSPFVFLTKGPVFEQVWAEVNGDSVLSYLKTPSSIFNFYKKSIIDEDLIWRFRNFEGLTNSSSLDNNIKNKSQKENLNEEYVCAKTTFSMAVLCEQTIERFGWKKLTGNLISKSGNLFSVKKHRLYYRNIISVSLRWLAEIESRRTVGLVDEAYIINCIRQAIRVAPLDDLNYKCLISFSSRFVKEEEKLQAKIRLFTLTEDLMWLE
mgnify:CR=1 FL=1|jgi:hypothetical protein